MVRSKGGVSGVMIINLLVSAGLQSSRASQVAVVVKNPPVSAGDARDTGLTLGQEDLLEKGMATHSSVLAWKIPWAEEPAGL